MGRSKLSTYNLNPKRQDQHRGKRTKPAKLLVIHTAESPLTLTSAEGVTRYCASGADGRRVSWHYATDPNSIASSLDEDYAAKATGSKTVDEQAIQIEIATYASTTWSNEAHQKTLAITAELAADICQRHKIPVKALTAAQLKSGHGGIISHNLSRIVYGGTTHTDPGPNFPWTDFIQLIKTHQTKPDAQNPLPTFTDPIKFGSKGAAVESIQKYFGISADGDFGPLTEHAVKGFQIAQNITIDGIFGPETQTKKSNPTVYQIKTVDYMADWLLHPQANVEGNEQTYRKLLQTWQTFIGLEPSGIYTPETLHRTKGWQAGKPGLSTDGIIGPKTWGTAFKL